MGNWFTDAMGTVGDWITNKKNNEQANADRGALRDQIGAAGSFANSGQMGFNQLGQESSDARNMLRDQATGKSSLSAEQLRQGLQQNLAAQRSMAASAAPANAAMAARTAATQAGRLGAGMSGQAAMAGIQERNQAALALNDAIARQRQMEMEAALQSRGQAMGGYGSLMQNQPKGWLEKYGPMLIAGGQLAAQKGATGGAA